MKGKDGARHLRRNDVNVAVHVCVIGRYMGAPVIQIKKQRDDPDDQHHGDNPEGDGPFLKIPQCHDPASLPTCL